MGASAAGCQTCAWCPSVAPGCQTCAWCPSVATGCQACARAHDPLPPRRPHPADACGPDVGQRQPAWVPVGRLVPGRCNWVPGVCLGARSAPSPARLHPADFCGPDVRQRQRAWVPEVRMVPGRASGCQTCARAHDPHPTRRDCTRHGASAPSAARLHQRGASARSGCRVSPPPGGLGDETPACIGFAWVRPGLGPPPSPAPAWASEEACAASPTVGSDPTGGPARDRLAWRPCRATGGRRGPSTRPSERATTG